VSELPKGWASIALEDAITPRSDRVSPQEIPDAEFIGMEHVEPHTNRIIETVPASTMASNAARFVAGDVLYGRMRPYLNKVVAPTFNGLASAEFIVFPLTDAVDSQFLLRRLSASDFTAFACSQYEGDRPRVKFDQLGKFDLRLPPRAEQTRIVAKLEELLSDLDAGVAELKAAQKKLAQYRQSLLKAAVEGALTAQWRAARSAPLSPGGRGAGGEGGSAADPHPLPNPSPVKGEGLENETGAQLLARILTERRARWEAKQLAKFADQGKTPPKDWQKKYPEPVSPDTSDLPELPQGWVWASAEQLCEFITKGTTPPKDIDDGSSPDVPFLRVTNLTSKGVLDFSDQVFVSDSTHRGFLTRSIVLPGDVLMNIVGPPLGQVSVVPDSYSEWNINQAIAIFRAVPGIANSFLCSWLLSLTACLWLKSRAKTTAGQTNLTLELCRSLPVPLPPECEQMQISELITEVLTAANNQQLAIEHSLKQSTAQRQNLLRAAFAGELVPQDPSDEPASALLERIRAERAAQAGVKKPRGRKVKESA